MRRLAVLLILSLFAAMPARAEWRRAESPNFVVYGDVSESRLRERILLLEDFDQLLRGLASVGDAPSPRLHIYVVGGTEDLRTIRPVADGIAGYYLATNEGIAAFVNGREERRGDELLLHEYAHHFMRQHMRGAWPSWYVEGFAEYFATVRFSNRRIEIGNYSRGRASQILQGQWLPMERLLTGGTDGLNEAAMSAYYAQSWLLVHYFYSNSERLRALSRLLGATRSGLNGRDALRLATGLTPEQLTDELRRYIRPGTIAYRYAPRASADAPPPITITAMPPSTGDLILFEGALRVGVAEENREPYLQRIRSITARYPDDPFAMRVLAHAELLHGDGAAADRLLDRLLASHEGDADLLYLKGLRQLTSAKSDDAPTDAAASARSWFARARAADPNHFQALVRYVESLDIAPEALSGEAREMLVQASRLAPHVASVALNAAIALLANGDHEEAERLLEPLASNPHDQDLAALARRLLDEARGGSSPEEGASQDPAPASEARDKSE